MNLMRIAPGIALIFMAGAWFNHSTKPNLIRGNELAREIPALESSIAEWSWLDSVEATGTMPLAATTQLSVKDLTAKVNACQVSLARLGRGPAGANFEVRSNYACMVHFLESVSSGGCQLGTLRKSDDGTLVASLTMADQ